MRSDRMSRITRRVVHTPWRRQKTEHWKDMDELHKALHKLPDYLKAIVLELFDRPMSRQDMQVYMQKLGRKMPKFGRKELPKVNLDDDIARAIESRVLEERNGKLHLTPGGREIAEHFNFFSLYYADAAASIAIGFLILKSAVELGIELTKPEGEAPHVSHFMGTAQERMRQRAVWRWLQEQLREGPLTHKELEVRFK